MSRPISRGYATRHAFHFSSVVATASLIAAAGCSGEISGLGATPGNSKNPDSPSRGSSGSAAGTSFGGTGSQSNEQGGGGTAGESPARDPDGAGYGDDPAGLVDRPAPFTRFARLTHTQWENTVADLFGLDDASGFSTDFRPDPNQQGFIFQNDVSSFEVDEVLWKAYRRAAEAVAETVAASPASLDRVLPATGSDDERARTFISEIGPRAHRRPLTQGEEDAYFALYQEGKTAYSDAGEFEGGIRLFIEGLLQSPHFIYRVETSEAASGETVPLNGYEIASRLSYMLWDTMPDDQLFEAAASGELTKADVAAEQAARMLEDERARSVVESFHSQLFDVERYRSISPAAAFFPDAPEALAALAETENRLFVEDVVFSKQAGLVELLTSNETFVNDELAKIYGLSGNFGSSFTPASLDPDTRRGFLTQVGFLASHATSVDPDPIHRGVFVAKRIACARIGAPPGNIPPLPPPDGRTNRETVEEHTQRDGTECASCHKVIINPLGFPFENYDAIGAFRKEDNGHPVNAATEPLVGGQAFQVENALELAQVLAESPAVHECYAQHWLEFAYGRPSVDADASLVKRLGGLSVDGQLSVKQLIVGLVKTDAFLTRSVEELP